MSWFEIALVFCWGLYNVRKGRAMLRQARRMEAHERYMRGEIGPRINLKVIAFAALCALLITIASAHAQADVEGPNCDGRVVRLQEAITLEPGDTETCSPKWVTRNVAQARRILTICPVGSHCHLEGSYSNRGIETITKVVRLS